MTTQLLASLCLRSGLFLASVILAQYLLSASVQCQETHQPEPIDVPQLRHLFDALAGESRGNARARISITTTNALVFEGALKEATDSAVVLRNVRSATGKSEREKSIEYSRISDFSIVSAKSIRRRDFIASTMAVVGGVLGGIAAVGTGEDNLVFVLPVAGGVAGWFVGFRSTGMERKRYVVIQNASVDTLSPDDFLLRGQSMRRGPRHLAHEREVPEYLRLSTPVMPSTR